MPATEQEIRNITKLGMTIGWISMKTWKIQWPLTRLMIKALNARFWSWDRFNKWTKICRKNGLSGWVKSIGRDISLPIRSMVWAIGRRMKLNELNKLKKEIERFFDENFPLFLQANSLIRRFGFEEVSFGNLLRYGKFELDNSASNENWGEEFDRLSEELQKAVDDFSNIAERFNGQLHLLHAMLIAKQENLTKLDLYLYGEISDFSPLSHPSFVNLTELGLSHMKISDLNHLSQLTNLKKLKLRRNDAIKDLSPLSSLVNLEELNLSRCRKIKDWSPLSSLPNLTKLNLEDIGISDLSFLSSLSNLKKLELSGNDAIEDLSPLSSLVNLEELNLSQCKGIKDLGALSSLVNLKRLSLHWCWKIEDISPLSFMPNLEKLDLGWCALVRDLTPLSSLPNLTEPDLTHCGKLPAASDALAVENIELRRIACEMILGWKHILKELNTTVIDEDGDPEIGILLEADIPDSDRERFLQVRCGTGRDFVLPVPPHVSTALEANAWTWGLEGYEYKPEVRT